MAYRIALVGNPNSGKTTLFNELTKLNQTVGNWPGVTIEKKEGKYSKDKGVEIVDLPGIYSLTPYSLEETITRNYITENRPDAIINIIDAINLERNLYLTLQLLEFGLPMVMALNMEDELKRNGVSINSEKLKELTGVEPVFISALKGRNIDTLMNKALSAASISAPKAMSFPAEVEEAAGAVTAAAPDEYKGRFYAVKLLERDQIYARKLDKASADAIEIAVKSLESKLGESSVEAVSNGRYFYIESVIRNIESRTVSKAQKITDAIDRIVTNKFLAFPIFAAIIFLMYYISISWLGSLTIDLLDGLIVGQFGEFVRESLTVAGAAGWLISLTVDGIIAGVGSVLTFIPQILILFLFISLLEGVGYMSRVAYIMDRLFKRIGLSGKSFIPMIIGCGCSVPAIMTARTIENNDERRLTIMLAPFIPCSAKLPVFALMAGVFFPDNPFAAPSMYLLGIVMVIVSGLILKKLKLFKTESDTFVLELPQYRVPKLRNVLMQLWEKTKSFIIKAGTIILSVSIVLWFLQSFSFRMEMVNAEESMLSGIGRAISWLFIPLGFGSWQAAVSVITGFLAKEAVVSTLGILTGVGEAGAGVYELSSLFNPLSAYAFMAFVLLAAPCLAAIGATRREMGGTKWMFIALGFQTLTAYITALVIYQIGSLYLNNKGIVISVLLALIIVLVLLFSIFSYRKRRSTCPGCCSGCSGCSSANTCKSNIDKK